MYSRKLRTNGDVALSCGRRGKGFLPYTCTLSDKFDESGAFGQFLEKGIHKVKWPIKKHLRNNASWNAPIHIRSPPGDIQDAMWAMASACKNWVTASPHYMAAYGEPPLFYGFPAMEPQKS
ncbi:hypothetical protein UY3_16349 [Chelonia mydas]|uniref:Uncharacterized protein n=1 Tax=Chelonia mydas TaxID=8469 RepID=M7APQ3_CHEMY|nr:hypothetical protein UY3_16349 [Chelonia mydas]